MADRVAALIVDLIADSSKLVTGVKQGQAALDSFGSQTIRASDMAQALGRNVETVGGNSLGKLSSGLLGVDKLLAAFGLRITPQLLALQEMAALSGTSAAALGTLGTAAAVAATALGAWKIGEWIGDQTGLTDAISDTIARLKGWNDTSTETHANAALLARASEIAGEEITDLAEAMAIARGEGARLAGTFSEIAEEEKRAAEITKQFRADLLKSFNEDVKRGNEAHRKGLAEREKLDADYRQFRNFIAERQMEDEDRRLKAELAAVKAQTDAMTAEMARAYEESAAQIQGQGAKLTAHQAVVDDTADAYRSLGLAIEMAIPKGFSFEKAFREAGFIIHNSISGIGRMPGFAGGTNGFVDFGTGTPVVLHGKEAVVPFDKAGSMGGIAVHIDARGAHFETPAAIQALADRVGRVLATRYSIGGGVAR